MAIPFVIIEGSVLIVDQNGELLDLVTTTSGVNRVPVQSVLFGVNSDGSLQNPIGSNNDALKIAIQGGNGTQIADVELIEGNPSLRTFGIQAIESLRGFDQIADSWFFIGTKLDSLGVGDAGDVVTVDIAAGDDAVKFPAVSVDTTVILNDDETDLGNNIVSNLNADPDFNLNYSARRLDLDAVTVYITSRQQGPRGSRPNTDDFQVSATGTTVVTRAFDSIIQRNKVTSLARDPANPTLGVLGISGSVTAGEGDVTGRIIEFARDTGGVGSELLTQDGSSTPVEFLILASPDKERFFTSLRFEAIGNGIQFGNFLSQNGSLATGLLVTIRSNDDEVEFPLIMNTEDFFSFFSRGPSDKDFDDVAGADYFRATLSFTAPFQVFKEGTFATDDFIKITVQDDLSSGISQFKFIGFGFEREF